MKVFYEEADNVLRDRHTSWKNKRDEWWAKGKREEEFYYADVDGTGTIFNKEQLKSISNGSNIPVSINFLYPIVNQKLAILVETKPTAKVVGIDQRGKNYAYILDKAFKSIMYRSAAIGEKEECIKNMLILGIGIDGFEEDPYHEFGTFSTEYKNYHPTLVILDADCKKRNLKSMRGYFVEQEVPTEEAKELYSEIIDEINYLNLANKKITIEDFCGTSLAVPIGKGSINETGLHKKLVVAEYYEKVISEAIFYQNERGEIEVTFEENMNEEERVKLVNEVERRKGKYVKRTLFLGDKKVFSEIKYLRDYAISVKFFEWGGRPYSSYGMVHYILGMQDAADRAIQSLLINGMLTNNAGYIGPKGGVAPDDVPKWESIGSKPGTLKEFVPQVINGVLVKPERETIQGLSNFYPSLIELMKSGMQFSTSITDVITGDTNSSTIDVFSTLQQYQSTAMKRILLAMSHVNLSDEVLANALIDQLIMNLNSEENYVFFDETDKLAEMKIAKEIMTDFRLSRLLVMSVSAQATQSQMLAASIEMMKIAQTAQDPYDRNIYLQEAYSLSGIKSFDAVSEKIDTKNRLSSQLAQMEKELERINEINKQLENRVINAELKAKIAQSQSDISALQAEAEQKIKNEVDKNKNDKKE